MEFINKNIFKQKPVAPDLLRKFASTSAQLGIQLYSSQRDKQYPICGQLSQLDAMEHLSSYEIQFSLNGLASLKTSLKQCSPREKDCTTCIVHAAPFLAGTKSQFSIYLISYDARKKKKTQHKPMRIEGPHIFYKLN